MASSSDMLVGTQVALAEYQARAQDPALELGNLLGKNRSYTPAEIDKVAMDFEAVFLTQMLRPVFESSGTQWFGGGVSEDIYTGMMVDQFGTLLAKSGGVGVADMVKRELLKLQEV